jgi:hypothetical protein
MKLALTILIASVVFAGFGQTKIVTGPKHAIFVDQPKNWVQAQNPQLPFFIKPDEPNVSKDTYMYVYGLDYEINPNMDGWIKGDIDDFKNKHPGMKVDTLQLDLPKLKEKSYQTGRYKIITYTYEDKRKQALLIIECRNTIATVVLSAKDDEEYDKYLPAFEETAKSVKVLGGMVKVEKQ